MTSRLSRRVFLAASAAIATCPGLARSGPPARSLRPVSRPEDLGQAPDAERLVREADLSGIVGFAVMDARTGALLEERASSAALPPASVAKVVTALYALDALGPEHRFETRVLATGGIAGGVVQGDLVLAGGGDPTLDTEALAALVAQLRQAGITGIRGGFKVWGGALPFARVIDPSQPDHVGYNPAVSGLNLNFNRVHFEWRRSGGGYAVTLEARTANHRPAVGMVRMDVADRTSPVYTYRDGGGVDLWTVASGALGQSGARWLPVRQPVPHAGDVFRSLARAEGISLPVPDPVEELPGGVVLAAHRSGRLEDLARDMLEFSTNLTAEVLGLAASASRLGRVASLDASAREMSAWARNSLGMGAATRFVDHSGLGDASRVTARDMAAALVRARQGTALRSLLKDIPVRDARQRILPDHPLEVVAKTGTLNFVSALAGYARMEGGRDMAFAVFVADTQRRAGLSRQDRERPPGGRTYARSARALQQALLSRWGAVHGLS